jgi:hypothetical protein
VVRWMRCRRMPGPMTTGIRVQENPCNNR